MKAGLLVAALMLGACGESECVRYGKALCAKAAQCMNFSGAEYSECERQFEEGVRQGKVTEASCKTSHELIDMLTCSEFIDWAARSRS